MRLMFGCCAALASIGFVIGFGAAFIAGGAASSLANRFSHAAFAGGLVAAMTFVAALLLSISDRIANARMRRLARERYLAGADWTEEAFCQALPNADSRVALLLREAVARFFEIPPEKVQPAEKFYVDEEGERAVPAVQFFVIAYVLNALQIPDRPYCLNAKRCSDPAGLAAKIQRLIERRDSPDAADDDDCSPPPNG